MIHKFDLSEALANLVAADWQSDLSPIRFKEDILLGEFSGARLFTNARLFLSAVANRESTQATQTGSLQRAVVSDMLRVLEWPRAYMEPIRNHFRVINELDVWPLHIIRITCEMAGLLIRRRSRFLATRKARELLADDKAGALYRRLFIACFRRVNLDYYSRFANEFPGIQQSFAVILWRLRDLAEDWVSAAGIIPRILLPSVLSEVKNGCVRRDNIPYIVSGHVYIPLTWFGLLEHNSEEPRFAVLGKCSIRKTALFDKFIEIEF